jgi:hypothetical protein
MSKLILQIYIPRDDFETIEILQLEQDLRISLNLLFLLIYHNSNNPDFTEELQSKN